MSEENKNIEDIEDIEESAEVTEEVEKSEGTEATEETEALDDACAVEEENDYFVSPEELPKKKGKKRPFRAQKCPLYFKRALFLLSYFFCKGGRPLSVSYRAEAFNRIIRQKPKVL